MTRIAMTAVLSAMLVLTLAGAGCGGQSAEEVSRERSEQVSVLVVNVEQANHSRKAACEKAIGAVLQSAQDLHARLRVGIVHADYVGRVGDMAVAYSKLQPIADPQCDAVRAPLRTAMRHYKQAGSGWFCRTCGPGRQRHWATAALLVKQARRTFNTLGDWSTETPSTEALVKTSIYAAAVNALCPPEDSTSTDACAKLESVLVGGITADEADALAEAVKNLNEVTTQDSAP